MRHIFFALLLALALPIMGQTTPDGEKPLQIMSNSPSRLMQDGYVLSEEKAIELLGEERYHEFSRHYENYHDGKLLMTCETPILAVLGAGAVAVAALDKSYDGSKKLYLLGGGMWCVAAATLTAGIIMKNKGMSKASKIIEGYNAGEVSLSLNAGGLTLHF